VVVAILSENDGIREFRLVLGLNLEDHFTLCILASKAEYTYGMFGS